MTKDVTVLVGDDDPVSSAQLGALARSTGYPVSRAANGRAAWDSMRAARMPGVISDWYMSELDGPALCGRIGARSHEPYVYFILDTAQGGKTRDRAGIEAGADDFSAKPVDPDELRARLTVAGCMLGLRRELNQLEGLLRICSYCKRIRTEQDEWESLETHIAKRFETHLTHTICPPCYARHVQPELDAL